MDSSAPLAHLEARYGNLPDTANCPTNPSNQDGSARSAAFLSVGSVRCQTQTIRPFLTKKWDRQPSRNHTDGERVGRFFWSTLMFQRGFTSASRGSSIGCPHPQGHRMPMDQFSPASLRSSKSRLGNRLGSPSASKVITLRGGSNSSLMRSHQMRMLMLRSPEIVPATPAEVHENLEPR